MGQEIHVNKFIASNSEDKKNILNHLDSEDRTNHWGKFLRMQKENKDEYILTKSILEPKYFFAFKEVLKSQNNSFVPEDFEDLSRFSHVEDKVVTKIGRFVIDLSLDGKQKFFELMDEQISPLLHQKQESTESSNLDKNDQVIEPNEINEIDPDLLKGAIAHKDELGYDDDEDKDEHDDEE